MATCSQSVRIAAVATLLCLAGCAGYRIGDRGMYPQDIHTVAVPMFRSVSFRRNLAEWLTEAVVKQIEATTPYKVVSEANAESVLNGRIISEGKSVLVPDLSGNAREVQVVMTVQVSWVDRQGRVLRECQTVPLPNELVDVTGTGNVVPEVGQSIATGQQQAIVRLAKQIVTLMEAPW